jgi:hypothetical protein
MRVCDKDTGRAIWVTEESAQKIEDTTVGARRRSVVVGMKTGEGVGYEAKDAEIKRLKEEIITLSEALRLEEEDSVKGRAIRLLEDEFMKLLEALKREKGAGGNGSNGVSSSTKLRETVLAERDI